MATPYTDKELRTMLSNREALLNFSRDEDICSWLERQVLLLKEVLMWRESAGEENPVETQTL